MVNETTAFQGVNANQREVDEFKRRILAWSNPVEFVNNMYGCHPDDEGSDYFKKIFSA